MESSLVNTAFLLMLGVTACYTVSSLSDKYAASKAKFSPNEFTFLMCSSMSVFLLFSLPFQEISFDFSFYAFLGVMLTALCKLFEFKMCSAVLREMSAFELKAWLGITLFVSYFTDILFGEQIRVLKLLCLGFTAAGLVMIVHSDKKEKVNYNKDNNTSPALYGSEIRLRTHHQELFLSRLLYDAASALACHRQPYYPSAGGSESI